jgi:hypothetical protein
MQAIVGGVLAFAVVVGWVLVRWRATGRDPSYLDDASILLPAPPEGMTAATATIVDGGPATNAFMAALFDLASRDEIAFRDETPDARGAHHVGIEIHGGHTDEPRILLNRRRPVGEGEAWLLANLKTFAAIDIGGATGDERAMAAMAAMSEFSGFIATALAKGPAGMAPGDLAEGMSSGPAPDLQEALITALTREGKPVPESLRSSASRHAPMMALMREVLADPAAVSADPEAFASHVEAVTGHAPTAEEMAELTTWLGKHQGASAAAGPASVTAAPGAEAYIAADRATTFHPPLGFGTFVENYARRKGWITGLSFIARWKWEGLAAVEVILGLIVASAGAADQQLVYGVGLGLAAGGVATWLGARFMASRTHEGAVMKAQLAAYRRTLKATFESSATLDDAVTATGLKWLETPDQALVWGVALGLRPEIEALLRRTTSGISAGTVAATAFLPRWIDRTTRIVSAVASEMAAAPAPPAGATTQAGPAGAAGADASTSTVRDYADVFAGIERVGSVATQHVAR